MRYNRGPGSGFLTFFAIVGVGLTVATRATASDGVIEINQARALAGGVTPGDAAGFPVTIGVSGSYRLTSNLDVTVAADPKNTLAISISANNVTIDLNGFSIVGPAICSGTPVTSCSNGGSGIGVFGTGQNVAVRNGTIRGMGNSGIRLVGSGTVERVRTESNGINGIEIGSGSVVSCGAASNGSNGIVLSGAGLQDLITGNVAAYNFAAGIDVFGVGTVSGNTSNMNGEGVIVGTALVSNNTFFDNTGVGIHAIGASAGYVGNVLDSNNGGGAQVSGGANLGQNLCNGALCP